MNGDLNSHGAIGLTLSALMSPPALEDRRHLGNCDEPEVWEGAGRSGCSYISLAPALVASRWKAPIGSMRLTPLRDGTGVVALIT
jgi:hypothetical protein